MAQAIFLDRDGTLNVDKEGYTYKIEDFELHEGVIEGLKLLGKDYILFIISNQSGIGRGYYSEEEMNKFNQHMFARFEKEGIKIEKFLFCPHTPEDSCDCRKPKTKLIDDLDSKYDIDLEKSWVIGDHGTDIKLARNIGSKAVYLLTGHGVKHLKEARENNPDYISTNFLHAAKFISKKNPQKILTRDQLIGEVENLQGKEKKIVTINGAFDILHQGHEKILSQSKKQGDVLIVGLNSDSSVKQNKGDDRPINTELSRALMLSCFDYIDYITFFEEKTPLSLLSIIKPKVHANGSEYGENCIEADVVKKFGGRIHVIELIPGQSTTKILEGQKNS